MVAVWIDNSSAIIADGKLVLSDGREFALSDIPGNGFNQNRLNKIAAAVQRVMDRGPHGRGIRPISSLAIDDDDRIHADNDEDGGVAWFLATYGGRMFRDGNEIVSRSTLFALTYDGENLVPHLTEVR